jgi:hypothetical protein
MNTQRGATPESLPHTRLSHPMTESLQQPIETELWEPPFERWLRLADDLLRDWPVSTKSANRI